MRASYPNMISSTVRQIGQNCVRNTDAAALGFNIPLNLPENLREDNLEVKVHFYLILQRRHSITAGSYTH
jgi:hypothetical protein